MSNASSSRHRYRQFVDDYQRGQLDDKIEAAGKKSDEPAPATAPAPALPAEKKPFWGIAAGKRREYLREYLRWLWPHRYRVGAVFVLALVAAGLQMIEPLFMRFIIDRVLLNTELDTASRLTRLHLAGVVFLGVIVALER